MALLQDLVLMAHLSFLQFVQSKPRLTTGLPRNCMVQDKMSRVSLVSFLDWPAIECASDFQTVNFYPSLKDMEK